VKTGYYQLNAVHHKTAGTRYLLKKFFRVDTQQVAALRSGVALMRELQLDMLLEPVELFEQGVQASILYADFPAISLRRFLEEKKRENFLLLKSLFPLSKNHQWSLTENALKKPRP